MGLNRFEKPFRNTDMKTETGADHKRFVFTHLEQNGQTFLEVRHREKFNVLLPLNRLGNKNKNIEKSGRIQAQCEES